MCKGHLIATCGADLHVFPSESAFSIKKMARSQGCVVCLCAFRAARCVYLQTSTRTRQPERFVSARPRQHRQHLCSTFTFVRSGSFLYGMVPLLSICLQPPWSLECLVGCLGSDGKSNIFKRSGPGWRGGHTHLVVALGFWTLCSKLEAPATKQRRCEMLKQIGLQSF